jgi:Fur family transcriptional regulator, peroxide stress response regulator
LKELRPHAWGIVTDRRNPAGRRSKTAGTSPFGTMETQPLDQQELRRAIECAGLRCTPQRLAVYEHLARSADHPTVEDVYRSVRSAMPKISLATVYKALEALVEIGAATKLTGGDGTSRSRYDARHEPHYHFRCLQTGDIFDLPTPFDASLIAKLDPRLPEYLTSQGFRVIGYRLELVGFHDQDTPVPPGSSSIQSGTGPPPFPTVGDS